MGRPPRPLLLGLVLAALATAAPIATRTAGAADPVLVGAGDIASCNSTGDEATADLLDGIAGTVFTVGDNAYNEGSAKNFANCYEASWGRHKARTRPAAGNHEYFSGNANGYFGYYGAAAGDPGQGWYSYDLGAWHVVVLNSNCAFVGGCGAGSPQEQWLRADLAAHPSACTAAFFHHPRFSSGANHGSHLSMQPFWQALYDFGADVVVSGHDHLYERFAPQDPTGAPEADGIRQFTVGTGGAGLYGFGTIKANSEVRSNAAHGVIKLSLHASSYDWEFVPAAGKTFRDSGTANCATGLRTSIISGPSGTVTSRSATFTFSASAPGATYECRLDGSPFAGCTSPQSYSGLADGSHTFEVRARTTDEVDPTPASRTWTVDTRPRFVAEADIRVEQDRPKKGGNGGTALRTDGSPVVESFVKFTVTGVTEPVVTCTLRVYATNGTNDGPAVYPTTTSWSEGGVRWDSRPLRTGGVVADTGAVASGSWVEYDVTDVVSGNGTYSFNLAQLSADEADFNSREAGSNRPELVVSVDGSAPPPPPPPDDTTPPQTTITSGPSGTVASSTATFGFSSSEAGSTFQCSLDGAAPSACTSPKTYNNMDDGQHTFTVAARDGAGNLDQTPASRTWTVSTGSLGSIFNFSPLADARVTEEFPSTNYGTTASLEADGEPRTESYIAFDVSGLDGPVDRAAVRLYVKNGSPDGPSVYPSAMDWSEMGITWNNRPARTGPAAADLGAVAVGSIVELDVTSVVTGNGSYSFNLAGLAMDGTNFASREDPANPTPVLVVETGSTGGSAASAAPVLVPAVLGALPAAGLAGLAALLRLSGARRRRRCAGGGAG
jgi:hypothetical protein